MPPAKGYPPPGRNDLGIITTIASSSIPYSQNRGGAAGAAKSSHLQGLPAGPNHPFVRAPLRSRRDRQVPRERDKPPAPASPWTPAPGRGSPSSGPAPERTARPATHAVSRRGPPARRGRQRDVSGYGYSSRGAAPVFPGCLGYPRGRYKPSLPLPPLLRRPPTSGLRFQGSAWQSLLSS